MLYILAAVVGTIVLLKQSKSSSKQSRYNKSTYKGSYKNYRD